LKQNDGVEGLKLTVRVGRPGAEACYRIGPDVVYSTTSYDYMSPRRSPLNLSGVFEEVNWILTRGVA